MEIHFETDGWSNCSDTWVKGFGYLHGSKLNSKEVAQNIAKCESKSEVINFLEKIYGFYSIIHETSNEIFLIADHIRSWPLFYTNDNGLQISDSSEWIFQNKPGQVCDPIAFTEYLFTGYVSGNETLDQEINQVQAGEIVSFDKEYDKLSHGVSRSRHYTYFSKQNSKRELVDVDDLFENVFTRFLDYVDGRNILLGLSGGYDSRLIALYLHKMGYQNVICFTHDLPSGNIEDIPIAESIADDLGYEHVNLTHTHADYRDFYNSPEFKELIKTSGYLSSFPSIQTAISLKKLKKKGYIGENTVFVRGHHGAFGTNIAKSAVGRPVINKSDFIEIIWRSSHNNWHKNRRLNKSNLTNVLEDRIIDRVHNRVYQRENVEPVSTAVAGAEAWFWQERCPKYLISNNEYDLFGVDRYLPLLDREILEFFMKSHYIQRVEKSLLVEYVNKLNAETDVAENYDRQAAAHYDNLSMNIWIIIKDIIKSSPDVVENLLREIRRIYKTNSNDSYDIDPRFGITSRDEFNGFTLKKLDNRSLLLLMLYEDDWFDLQGGEDIENILQIK